MSVALPYLSATLVLAIVQVLIAAAAKRAQEGGSPMAWATVMHPNRTIPVSPAA